jgi:hypothetical protein
MLRGKPAYAAGLQTSNTQHRTSNSEHPTPKAFASKASDIQHRMLRILSGIQPSGALPNGNYFGMMRPG